MTIDLYTVGFGEQKEASIDVLGGKAFNLVKMANMGVNVPPAVTVPTTYCHAVNNKTMTPMEIQVAVYEQLEKIEAMFGYMPLFSVRSGAKISMPGMMDTILNVGLCASTIAQWEKRIGIRTTWDSYRRLIQMFGVVVFDIPYSKYDEVMTTVKASENVLIDSDISVVGLKLIASRFLEITPDFPQSFKMQLRKAIGAVFTSWNSSRAITYRNLHNISHTMGTAVTVQSMVFGNMNDNSCTGVLFTRNHSTGANVVVGEFLVNAQGEDVVAGIRTPDPLPEMEAWNSAVLVELKTVVKKLEADAKDMQDVEFTVQDGKLYILQTRNAKRTAMAAVQVAVDLVAEGVLTKQEAFKRVSYEQYNTAQRPIINPAFDTTPTGTGIPASSGITVGVVAFSSDKAVELAKTMPVILLAKETTPDDIAGMHAAAGILTQTGGNSSHAAVVARGMDKVCVVGCLDLQVKVANMGGEPIVWELNGVTIEEGITKVTLEGNTGKIWINVDVDIIGSENNEAIATFNSWATDMLPYLEKVTEGKSGYLETYLFDNNLDALKETVTDFEGIISLNTGKNNLEVYDKELFELVAAFDDLSIKKVKLAALANVKATKEVFLDVEGVEISDSIKAKLIVNGYKIVPVISDWKGVVNGKGLVRYANTFVIDNDIQQIIDMKEIKGDFLKTLMFIEDSKDFSVPAGATLVASKEEVIKHLMK